MTKIKCMQITINPTIDFPVEVNGIKLIASIIEEIIPPYQIEFKIKFSNGYEDVFRVGEIGVEGRKDSSAPYAKAISKELPIVVGMDPNSFYHVFQYKIDGAVNNVWVIEGETDNKTVYKVFYNRLYRFELSGEPKNWTITQSSRIYREVDEDLAMRVGYLLDSLL